MPIYEFYCTPCNTIYSFFARKITDATPATCPECGGPSLSRQISRFSVTKGGTSSGTDSESGEGTGDLPIDEAKMTRAMEVLARESEGLREDDPRAAAHLMRKFSDLTGVGYNDKMESALSRLEAGEDPDSIEKEMGDVDENDLFILPEKHKGSRRGQPLRSERLYEM